MMTNPEIRPAKAGEVATEAVHLHARVLGEGGAGVPLVLLHGLLGSSRNWQTAGAELAARLGRTVYALDLRNHGRSPWAERMDYPALGADLLAWLDAQLPGQTVDLLGHSLGGKTAMAFAAHFPARLRRLVVVDIAPRAYLSLGHRTEFTAMHELRLEALTSRGEAELRLEGRVPDWAMRKFLVTNLERGEDGAWRWIVNLPVLAAALPTLEQDPLGPGSAIALPTLLVRGGRSAYVTEQDLAALPSRVPALEVHTFAQAGHNPHLDVRAEFCARVAEFLAKT
jgi:esterase